MVSRSCGARNSRGGWISGTCRTIWRRWWYCHFCDVFWRDFRTFFASCFNSHLGFYLQPTVFGENRPTDWQAAVFFLRPKHWRSLEKPWHLLPWAHLANGRRAAATPRWRYVVGSHRRDFRSQVVLGCFFWKVIFMYNNSKGVCVHIMSIRYNPLYTYVYIYIIYIYSMSITVLYITFSYD